MQELIDGKELSAYITKLATTEASKVISEGKKAVDKINKEVDATLENKRSEAKKEVDSALELYKREREAQFILQKDRMTLTYLDRAVVKEVNKYFDKVSDLEAIKLLLKEYSSCLELVKDKEVIVYYYGVEERTVKEAVANGLKVKEYIKSVFNKTEREEDSGIVNKRGIIIDKVDNSIRCVLTLSSYFSMLQDKYREEIVQKFFGNVKERLKMASNNAN